MSRVSGLTHDFKALMLRLSPKGNSKGPVHKQIVSPELPRAPESFPELLTAPQSSLEFPRAKQDSQQSMVQTDSTEHRRNRAEHSRESTEHRVLCTDCKTSQQ